MDVKEIVEFAKEKIEPIGPKLDMYRCSAYLRDGAFLPCVVIQSSRNIVDLAIRRFDETRAGTAKVRISYAELVKSFVARGNCVNDYDLRSIECSPFAISSERMNEVIGETSMSWTEFTVVMDDGKQFPFGTTFLMQFFEMPEGYSATRIKRIIPHEIGKPKLRGTDVRVYRERPFFDCFVDGL